jgi:K+-transporting ATPase ATPase C chain
MKSNFFPALRLTLTLLVLCAVIYPLSIWAMALLSPDKGAGKMIHTAGKSYYTHIGQSFTEDRYFNGRPSAVAYNAAASGGSNKGPSDSAYLASVNTRIDSFLAHNPGISRKDIPVELVTASGSGLDPDLSPAAARVQIKRIAKLRGLTEQQLQNLVASHIQKPLLGLFGPEKINVLKLNLDLDQINNNAK